MIQYMENGDLAVFDGLKFRLDKKTGYYLNSKHHKRLHRAVWEKERGMIPKGYHVHHIDHNKGNNDIANLCVMKGERHSGIHLTERVNTNPAATRAHLLSIQPLAAEWHGSPAGKAWHSEHARETAKNLLPREYTCHHCGKRFYKKPLGTNKFCSNNCKSAYRRASGVDDVQKICGHCGGVYIASKYQNSRYCSSLCRGRARSEHKARGTG